MTGRQLATRRNAALARSVEDIDRVDGGPEFGWLVDSSSTRGVYYSVTPDYRCSCEAGRQGYPCRHAAAAFRVKFGLGRSRVTVRG